MRNDFKKGQLVVTSGAAVVAFLPSNKDGEADAEFIVRAVNSHEDLLAMAKAYYRTLPDDGPEQDHYIRILEKAEGKGA